MTLRQPQDSKACAAQRSTQRDACRFQLQEFTTLQCGCAQSARRLVCSSAQQAACGAAGQHCDLAREQGAHLIASYESLRGVTVGAEFQEGVYREMEHSMVNKRAETELALFTCVQHVRASPAAWKRQWAAVQTDTCIVGSSNSCHRL